MSNQKINELKAELQALQNKKQNQENLKKIIDKLNELSYAYYSISPTKAEDYADRAISKAKTIDYKKGLGQALTRKGIVKWEISDYTSALEIYKKSLKIFQVIGFKLGIGNVYNNIGLVYLKTGKFNKALEHFQKSLSFYNKDYEKASSFVHIGLIYKNMKKYDIALHYYEKALKLFRKINNKKFEAHCYDNIANVLCIEKKYDEAKKYYLKALQLEKSIEEKGSIASSYLNLGSLYIDYGNLQKALKYFRKSLLIDKEIDNKDGIAEAYCEIGKIYTKLKKYDLALKNLTKGLEITKATNLKNITMEIYETISELFKLQKKFRECYEYHKKYSKLKDEVYNEDLNKKIAELQAKFDFETQKKEAEIYRLKNIELKKANASKDRFFSIVAHDLKSPFSIIISFVNIMKKAFDDYNKDQIMNLINELEQSTKNTFNLLKNLLDWSRMQSGVIDFLPEEFNLNKVIQKVTRLLIPRAKQKNIKLIVNIRENIRVYGDVNMITTVIRNLVNNAIKFTEPEGLIEISVQTDNGQVYVSVSDNGIGIKKENIPKLFKIESNFSTYGTAYEKGTGLGLILVKEFIEKNNGSIKVKSEKGKGSEFTINLPLAKSKKN